MGLYRVFMGIMENKMETTIEGLGLGYLEPYKLTQVRIP